MHYVAALGLALMVGGMVFWLSRKAEEDTLNETEEWEREQRWRQWANRRKPK